MFFMNQPIYLDSPQAEAALGLCRLDCEGLCEGYLTGDEQREYAKLSSVTRKREWLAARVALKRILLETGGIHSPRSCQIDKDRYGCPQLTIAGREEGPSPCSISHKAGLAAVCVSFRPEIRVGIDVEKISEKPRRLQHAFAVEEDSIFGIFEASKYYTLLWACKEAASKVMGLGMLKNFKDMVVTAKEDRSFSVSHDEGRLIHGRYTFFQGLAVAVASPLKMIQGNFL